MTEDQAAKKHCPILERGNCIGSSCMAWRWGKITKDVAENEKEKAVKDGFKLVGYEIANFDVTYKMAKTTSSGYCGLGGAP